MLQAHQTNQDKSSLLVLLVKSCCTSRQLFCSLAIFAVAQSAGIDFNWGGGGGVLNYLKLIPPAQQCPEGHSSMSLIVPKSEIETKNANTGTSTASLVSRKSYWSAQHHEHSNTSSVLHRIMSSPPHHESSTASWALHRIGLQPQHSPLRSPALARSSVSRQRQRRCREVQSRGLAVAFAPAFFLPRQIDGSLSCFCPK